jgi:hypothetical protein
MQIARKRGTGDHPEEKETRYKKDRDMTVDNNIAMETSYVANSQAAMQTLTSTIRASAESQACGTFGCLFEEVVRL